MVGRWAVILLVEEHYQSAWKSTAFNVSLLSYEIASKRLYASSVLPSDKSISLGGL
jgi:hypothetical protein